MRSIALANQKGGVGKTTTAIHLAHGLALAGRKVALFDLDPQGNATIALQGMAESEAAEAAESEGPLGVLIPLEQGFWMLPSPGADRPVADLRPDVEKLHQLTLGLEEAGVDFLVVDCPPRMDAWGMAGLRLCQQVVLPMQAEFFSMHGLSQMMETLRRARQQWRDRARLAGVLVTMLDVREPISMEVVEDLRRNLGDKLLDTLVFRDSSFVEAASHGRTLFDYDLGAVGAHCYSDLVREVLYGRPKTR
jgi:chromosome partitioning protein